MSPRRSHYLLGFMALLAVGMACGTPSPAAEPTLKPTQLSSTEPAAVTSSSKGDGWTSFTDKGSYFAIDLPADWDRSQTADNENSFWYWDVFKSPDGHAGIESIVYDDGQPLARSQTGKTALLWLRQNYSSTGEAGDIRISEDHFEKDGSERLTWTSLGGGRSGISYFELRQPSALLMFTIWWDDEYEDDYFGTLDRVVRSYRVP